MLKLKAIQLYSVAKFIAHGNVFHIHFSFYANVTEYVIGTNVKIGHVCGGTKVIVQLELVRHGYDILAVLEFHRLLRICRLISSPLFSTTKVDYRTTTFSTEAMTTMNVFVR